MSVQIASSTDELGIVQAVAAGKEARTMGENQSEVETSEDGSVTAVSTESESSERRTLLQRLEQAEQDAEQDLRDWKPLTETDKAAKLRVLAESNAAGYDAALEGAKRNRPDWDEVFANPAANVELSEHKIALLQEAGPESAYDLAKNPELAQQFANLPDDQAEAFLKGNQTQESGQKSEYDRALEQVVSEGGNPEQFAETMQTQIFPDSDEGRAKYAVLAYALGQVSNRREIVLALAKDSQALAKVANAETPEALAKEVHKLSARLKFGQTAQTTSAPVKRSTLAPTKPVGGSMKGTVKMDEMSYEDYRAAREKQIKARRARLG